MASRSAPELERDLRRLGVERGMTLMVHSSLRAIGRVDGGAPTVVRALLAVVGDEGTLVMPAARVTAGDDVPVFDLTTTPTTLGAIPETFRTWPGTARSDHPLESVCAHGAAAATITAEHPLAFSEGRGGPFEKLYRRDAWTLLLGVGFNRCTSLHHAESRVEKRRVTTVRFPQIEQGQRVWREVPNVADDNDTHFPIVGERYLATGRPVVGRVGEAESVLFCTRDLVDFAVRYFEEVL